MTLLAASGAANPAVKEKASASRPRFLSAGPWRRHLRPTWRSARPQPRPRPRHRHPRGRHRALCLRANVVAARDFSICRRARHRPGMGYRGVVTLGNLAQRLASVDRRRASDRRQRWRPKRRARGRAHLVPAPTRLRAPGLPGWCPTGPDGFPEPPPRPRDGKLATRRRRNRQETGSPRSLSRRGAVGHRQDRLRQRPRAVRVVAHAVLSDPASA